MDITNEIAKRYKKMSNSELMDVLQNPSHYQPAALSIARSEFTSRQLSEQEIQEAKLFLLTRDLKREKQHERVEIAKSKIMDAGNTLYDTINPIQTTAPTSEKFIRLITLVFSGLFLYKIIVNLDLFAAIIKGDLAERFAYTTIIFPVVVGLFAILLFWLRKQLGWTLLAAFCSYSLMEAFYGFYHSISWQFKETSFVHFSPTPSPTAYILSALFYIGTIFVMKKHDIREVYKIDNQQLLGSLIVGGLIGILFLFLLLSY